MRLLVAMPEGVLRDSFFPPDILTMLRSLGDVRCQTGERAWTAEELRDALPGVQSVQQGVDHPDEISTLFDSAIVYAKGERLLKMLRAYLGEDNFREGRGRGQQTVRRAYYKMQVRRL